MAEDTIRILRVLEYVGPRKAVEEHLAQRGVIGQKSWTPKDFLPTQEITIREAVLGEFAEVVRKADWEPSIG